MHILQINGSARRQGSNSTKVANRIVERLRHTHPDATLTVRDLATHPARILDEAALAALYTPAEKRTPEQATRVADDDALIAEVQAADILVIGAPMYNLGISVQLKSWFDAICRARVTFKYTENGPVGLLNDKKVYVGFSRGGHYRNTPHENEASYLRSVLGFLGITDVSFVFAEGMSMGPEAEEKGMAAAHAEIEALFA